MIKTIFRHGRLLLLCALTGLVGCGSQPPGSGSSWRSQPHDPGPLTLPAAAVPCPGDLRPEVNREFRLALPGTVVPSHAPLPATEAERHLFRNLYETLVRVGCDGAPGPGLAVRWEAFAEGHVWVLTLREGATFWDGSPADATAVVASWRRAAALCRLRGEPDPFLLFSPTGSALQVMGPQELVIRLAAASDLLPLLLAHPALAITGPPDGRGWLAGSGPMSPASSPRDQRLELRPRTDHPQAPIWERLTVSLVIDADERSLLDLGQDALVTRQHDVVAYYEGRRATRLEALPWDRRYFLIVPGEPVGAEERDRRRWTAGWDRIELAREVTSQEAAPADFFAFEPPSQLCPELANPVPVLANPGLTHTEAQASRDADLIVWPADDSDAGLMAERLAVLAARPLRPGPDLPSRGPLTPPVPPGPGVAPEAASVIPSKLTAHVQAGKAGALILPWPRRFPAPCHELARLLSLSTWLQEAAQDPAADTGLIPPGATAARPLDQAEPPRVLAMARRLEQTRTVQPLVQSRAYLVRVPGLVGLSCDYDGCLRLWTGGWQARSIR